MNADTAESIDATLAHLDTLTQRRDYLVARKLEAEEQVLHRVGMAVRAGEMTTSDLAAFYETFRTVAEPGFTKRWDAAVGVPLAPLRGAVQHRRTRPNGDDGSWHGAYPLGEWEPAPVAGTAVVYVLYDERWEPVYVGSTGTFRNRLKQHRRDGRDFTHWRCWPCKDRDEAYRREGEMLREVMPAQNKNRGRAA